MPSLAMRPGFASNTRTWHSERTVSNRKTLAAQQRFPFALQRFSTLLQSRVRRPSALRASNAPSHRTRLIDCRTHRSEHAPRCPFRPCPLATVPLRVPLVMKIRIAYLPHRRRDILPTHCSFGRIVGRIGVRYLRDRSDHATASTRSCQN